MSELISSYLNQTKKAALFVFIVPLILQRGLMR